MAREIERNWKSEPSAVERDVAFVRAAGGFLEGAITALESSASCSTDPLCSAELAEYLYTAGVRSSDPDRLLDALASADRALKRNSDLTAARAVRNAAAVALGLAVRERREEGQLPSSPQGWEQLAQRLRTAPYAEENLLAQLAREAPQFARQVGCERLLPDASDHLLAGRADQASSTIAAALRLGEGLAKHSGDRTLLTTARELEEILRAERPDDRKAFLRAFRSYGKARAAIREERYGEASSLLLDALPALTGSALFPWAEHAAAVARRFAEGGTRRSRFEDILSTAPESAPALRAHTNWSLAVLSDLGGDLPDAVEHFGKAIDEFERLGEWENVAVLHSFRAFSLFDLGRDREAKADLLRAASLRPHLSTYDSLEIVLDSWLALLVSPRFPEFAWHFQDELVSAARGSGRPSMLSQALLVRGENSKTPTEDRLRYLDEASTAAAAIEESRERTRKEALIAIARARALLSTSPEGSLKALDEGLSFYSDPEFQHLRLEALVVRAAALLRGTDQEAALRAHLEGIKLLEATLLRAQTFRDRYGLMRETRALFVGLAELQLASKGDPAEVRAIVRQAGAISVGKRKHLLGASERSTDLRRAPPAGVTLLEFAVLGGELRAWTTVSEKSSFHSFGVRIEDLLERKLELEAALRADRENEAARISRELGSVLLSTLSGLPVGPLWIVPDPALFDLAWPALVDPNSGDPLGVARELTLLPHLEPIDRSEALLDAGSLSRTVRLVGVSRALQNGMFLQELASVKIEIERLRLFYPASTALFDLDATPTAVLRQPMPALLHIAAHAVPGVAANEPPLLALAPDATTPSGLLDAFEIAEADLARVRVVVLPACESSRGAPQRTEAPLSLSTAFLAAGAESVIASAWPIDDSSTAYLMLRLHRELANATNASEALRRTLAAAREELPSRPSIWAAFATWARLPTSRECTLSETKCN